LTGPWTSEGVAQVAQDVAIPSEVLQISPVATGHDVADLKDHDLVDSTALPTSTEGQAIADAIEQSLGDIDGSTVNVGVNPDSGAEDVAGDFVKAWQEADGTARGPTVLPSPVSGTGIAEITNDNPDAVLLIDNSAGFAKLAPVLIGLPGWSTATAWGNDQLVSPGLPKDAGTRNIEGLRALAPGMPQGAEPTSAFVSALESALPKGVQPAPYAAQEFDATILCYLAAVAAGSTEGQQMADELIDITAPGGTEFTWQQLPEAIKALEDGEDIDYTGASGPIDMDVHGDPTAGVFDVYRYSGGKLVLDGEISVEKANPATP